MKRFGTGGTRRQREKIQSAVMCLAIAAAAGLGLIRAGGFLLPAVEQLGQDAALLAGAAAMPEGTAEAIRQRFAGYVYSPEDGSPDELPPPDLSRPEPDPPAASSSPREQPPEVSEEYRGILVAETMSGSESNVCYPAGAGYIRNYTDLSRAVIDAELAKPLKLAPKADGRVEVLILHTHATESYEGYDADYYDKRNTWRSTDNNKNMVAVGNILEEKLTQAGIGVVHDTAQYDYPSYNGSYDRAAVAIQNYLAEYPDIQLILDVHRDGIQRDENTIVKPYTVINGKKAAQVMILCGTEPDGWTDNLRTAAAVTDALESACPTLMRPIFLSGGRYNMDLCGGTILLEFGSQANTLEEALYAAELAGDALADYLLALSSPE